MCFVHVLLNALDLSDKGIESGVVLEGGATTLVAKLTDPGSPLHPLYEKCRARGLMLGA